MDSKAQLARFGLFDADVPRYTSYPTTAQFTDTIGPDDHSAWVRAIPDGNKISIYVHVPFCRRLCWFCAYRTQGTRNDHPIAAYLNVIKAELALLSADLPQGVTLSRLYWGGGTPTLLTPSMIADLTETIRAVVPFAEDTEFSVEIDPTEIDSTRLDALMHAGLSHAVIGIQDFDPLVQAAIGRIQSFDATRDVVAELRARSIEHISVGILYGLPHQTPVRIAQSVQHLLSLNPDRIALYGYAHVPGIAKRQQLIPSADLPTPQERLALFQAAQELLVWDGYSQIGIDHFCGVADGLPQAQQTGQLRRSFQGYTDDPADVLIGIGASAISHFPQGYTQNAPATGAYAAAIQAGQYATQRGHAYRGDDLMRARVIQALMCDFTVCRARLCRDLDISADALHRLLAEVAARFPNLLQLDEEGLTIPTEARLLTRVIARAFDGYAVDMSGHWSPF
ncbi:oxygen-independent coproporphyrinogen III oxidase [Roseovarius pelagicus]|uniref:Coproporphyrinogen-III oxidase n=1 Tax=Roseovarius pelagicus TaxID=2980108 RepID=A0ABY6DET7_9RHOB|nr:oxygen-independent coproporphyrinogen III oxidase [Roseovarius pelagicus]UXX84589.1 oxygen-independent coproporphyrinogen III oxidase [Roseovarius pelagicus]